MCYNSIKINVVTSWPEEHFYTSKRSSLQPLFVDIPPRYLQPVDVWKVDKRLIDLQLCRRSHPLTLAAKSVVKVIPSAGLNIAVGKRPMHLPVYISRALKMRLVLAHCPTLCSASCISLLVLDEWRAEKSPQSTTPWQLNGQNCPG